MSQQSFRALGVSDEVAQALAARDITHPFPIQALVLREAFAGSDLLAKARKNGSIMMFDQEHNEVARWNFINAWPSKLTTGSLKAGSNDVVTEEATIVMEGFERVK